MNPNGTSPTWGNWTGNIVHQPPTNGANYYFMPTNMAELKSILADAEQRKCRSVYPGSGILSRRWSPTIIEEQ